MAMENIHNTFEPHNPTDSQEADVVEIQGFGMSQEALRATVFVAAAGATAVTAAILEKNFGWITEAWDAFSTSPSDKLNR